MIHRLALVFGYDLGYCRGILRGIRAYARQRPDWLFTLVDPLGNIRQALRRLSPSGVIAHIYSPRLLRALAGLEVPVVNVAGVLAKTPFPRVGLEDRAIGITAAEHLLASGFRHFAFAGHADQAYSRLREEGFRSRLAASGFITEAYHLRGVAFDPHGQPWALDAGLCRWLRDLPRPIGVLACNDLWGHQLTEACREVGRRVPEDLAIVGVDNDDLLCELSRPSLSSVQVPSEAVGEAAARLLDRLIGGGPAPRRPLLLPPVGVVLRQSSDVLAMEDELVAEALRYLRQRTFTTISIRELLRHIAVSRRQLERRFRAQLGRGIWEELRRLRLQQACSLLAGSSMPVSQVATACGFTDARHLSVTFRKVLNSTPTAYRAASRGNAAKR